MAIAYDTKTEAQTSGSGVNPLNFSHTCSGSDRFLYVAVTTINRSATPTATYNGVSMTPVYTNIPVFSTTWEHAGFYLVNPASGSNTVSISCTVGSGNNTIRAGATSYTGVDQTTPILATNSASSPGTGNNMLISLTTASDGWFIISGANVDLAFSAGANTDELRATYSGLADIADSGNDITAGTTNAQMTHAGTRGYGGCAIAILPAGGGGGPTTNSAFLAFM